jgi:hypothetical protein
VDVSATGGASWTQAALPTDGSHTVFLGPGVLGPGIISQENRLYTGLVVDPGSTATALVANALMVSQDDGATWQWTNQAPMDGQHCLGSIAAPTTGTTLFATTLSRCDGQASASASAQIWRSDDAGAHWTRAGSLPATAAASLKVVHVSDQAQPVLILTSALDLQSFEQSMDFSLDDGKTWHPVPALAGPLDEPGLVWILHDGSLLDQSSNAFFAWKAGEAHWHQVAPSLGVVVAGPVVITDKNGKETLYLEAQVNNAFSFYTIDLA